MAAAAALGIWSLVNSVLISRDGVRWIEYARRLPQTESVSGAAGIRGQKYLFWPDQKGAEAGMGVSVGTNGISVFEHGKGHMPAGAVYWGPIGKGWNHIAVTYTGKQPAIYVNGVHVRTGLTSLRPRVYAPRIVGGGGYGHFRGAVNTIKIWDRALTAEEVLAETAGQPGGAKPVGCWKLDEGKGERANDSSGNAYSATIKGATWISYQDGYALQFDGADDTMVMRYSPPVDNFTISAWVQAAEEHEIESMALQLSKIRDAGLPLMVYGWHRVLGFFGLGEGIFGWLLAGQTLTLIFRMLSLLPLYYIGKHLVGGRYAFLSLFILVFLPWPAEWGTDVLREWPHLFFLSLGFALVVWAFSSGRFILMLPGGLISGLGHTIRPECAQIIIYAVTGLILVFVRPASALSRNQALRGMVWLIGGFSIVFLPYVYARGGILPQKLDELLTVNMKARSITASDATGNAVTPVCAGIVSSPIEGVVNLVQHLCENLYYYFFPFMVIGLCLFYLRSHRNSFSMWFMAGFIVFNIIMLTVLHHCWGYISRRHLLPLTAMTVFFVPPGLDAAAGLLCRRKTGRADTRQKNTVFWIMFAVGLIVCVPKLAKPTSSEIGFRKAADFLRQHTPKDAVLAVPDRRIAFYAERFGHVRQSPSEGGSWDYLVVIEDHETQSVEPALPSLVRLFSCPLREIRSKKDVVVYGHNKDVK